jgi:hypothetical protein
MMGRRRKHQPINQQRVNQSTRIGLGTYYPTVAYKVYENELPVHSVPIRSTTTVRPLSSRKC